MSPAEVPAFPYLKQRHARCQGVLESSNEMSRSIPRGSDLPSARGILVRTRSFCPLCGGLGEMPAVRVRAPGQSSSSDFLSARVRLCSHLSELIDALGLEEGAPEPHCSSAAPVCSCGGSLCAQCQAPSVPRSPKIFPCFTTRLLLGPFPCFSEQNLN